MSARKKTQLGIGELIERRVDNMVDKALEREKEKLRHKTGERPQGAASEMEISALIDQYAQKAAAISGSLSLIPGPLGVLAVYKEMQLILQTQIEMIAALSLRLHKHEDLSKEILLGIIATVFGTVGIRFLANQGGQYILEKVSAEISKRIAQSIGKSVAQKTVQHMAAKWIPLAGSALIFAYTQRATKILGHKTKNILMAEKEAF